jgi:iron complex transport system permease protein
MVIIWEYRLPTALMAIGVGAALGFAGAVMQTILNNPLASPYTLGVSAGAGFGAAFAIVSGASALSVIGGYTIPFFAFLFAAITCFSIYAFGKYTKMTPQTMILAGIGLSFLFQALQSLMQYIATPEESQNIVFWLFGSLSRANWFTVAVIFITLIVVIPLMLKDAWRLTALKLGDEKAMGLGVNIERLRIKSFALVSIVTGAAVCFVGTIGFIGLVGPHIARMLIGEDQRFFIPLSALCGALVLSLASILSKIIVPGFIFPIGIITSLIGVPFFFSLVVSKRKGFVND